jgi:hypothetical protein
MAGYRLTCAAAVCSAFGSTSGLLARPHPSRHSRQCVAQDMQDLRPSQTQEAVAELFDTSVSCLAQPSSAVNVAQFPHRSSHRYLHHTLARDTAAGRHRGARKPGMRGHVAQPCCRERTQEARRIHMTPHLYVAGVLLVPNSRVVVDGYVRGLREAQRGHERGSLIHVLGKPVSGWFLR